MRNFKLIFITPIILIASGLSFYLLTHVGKTLPTPHPSSNPDTYLMDATYHRMDKNGRQYTQLKAEYVQHTPHQNTTRLHNPILDIQNEENHWHIRAAHARSENELESIYLWKHVVIERDETSMDTSLTATTESLLVFPHNQLVETNNAVTIERPGLKVSGKGLLGNLKHGNLKILKHLQSTINPIS